MNDGRDNKIWQEFYCNDCPDGNYIMVRLNMGLNHSVEVVCPECGAKHHRTIKNGQLFDGKNGTVVEQICPPKSACSKESRTAKMFKNARDGVLVEESDADKIRRDMMRERWIELYGNGGYGGQE
jgi:hypothetical protein